jgi:hypothetical protein
LAFAIDADVAGIACNAASAAVFVMIHDICANSMTAYFMGLAGSTSHLDNGTVVVTAENCNEYAEEW